MPNARDRMMAEAASGRVTVREALRLANFVLRETRVETSRLDAELLLAHHLGITRSQLLARLDLALDPEVENGYHALLERRSLHEPVAYITGYKEFYGLKIQVDHRVPIPRPETEILVEVALASARQGEPPMAEVGTGSGAVAVALAVNLPQAEIYATDLSAAALEVAEENCRHHNVLDRIFLLEGDLLEPLPEPVALVVANLPYLSRQELEEAPPEVAKYEPRRAFDGGLDGLDQYRRLFAQAPSHLLPRASICLEVGASQAQAISRIAREQFPQAKVAVIKDLAGLDRVVFIMTQRGGR